MKQIYVRKSKHELVEALQVAESVSGPNHLNTAHALEELALFLSSEDLDSPPPAEVEPMCRRATEIIKNIFGDKSIEYSDAALVHAQTLDHIEQYEECANIAFQSWRLSNSLIGAKHESTKNKFYIFLGCIGLIEKSGRSCSINLTINSKKLFSLVVNSGDSR
jgi:hypothetical protein